MASYTTTAAGTLSAWHLVERAYAHMWARNEEFFYPLVLRAELLSVAQREEFGFPTVRVGDAVAPIAYVLLSPTLVGHTTWRGVLACVFKDVRITAQAMLDIDYARRPRITPLAAKYMPSSAVEGIDSEVRAALCPGRLLARIYVVDNSIITGVIGTTIVGVFRAQLMGAPLRFPTPSARQNPWSAPSSVVAVKRT